MNVNNNFIFIDMEMIMASIQIDINLQETHQELAERTGKHVVEYRPEKGNRPIVVASPSQKAVKRRIIEEKKQKEEDITKYFDEYRGAHRPKSLKDIQGTHPPLLRDLQQIAILNLSFFFSYVLVFFNEFADVNFRVTTDNCWKYQERKGATVYLLPEPIIFGKDKIKQ